MYASKMQHDYPSFPQRKARATNFSYRNNDMHPTDIHAEPRYQQQNGTHPTYRETAYHRASHPYPD